jgi:hypothetical protein
LAFIPFFVWLLGPTLPIPALGVFTITELVKTHHGRIDVIEERRLDRRGRRLPPRRLVTLRAISLWNQGLDGAIGRLPVHNYKENIERRGGEFRIYLMVLGL